MKIFERGCNHGGYVNGMKKKKRKKALGPNQEKVGTLLNNGLLFEVVV